MVGSACLSEFVCVTVHISPMERLFLLKTLSRTQRATKVKEFVGFSLKPLRCRDPALPPLYGHTCNRPFFPAKSTHAQFSRGGLFWKVEGRVEPCPKVSIPMQLACVAARTDREVYTVTPRGVANNRSLLA